MRVKKQKQNRKTVRFYKACFAFREPYKILCDGTFVHKMLESRLGAASEALSALLGGHTKVFVTRCVINELKKLGESFSGTVLATRRLTTARCNHEMLKSAAECLEAMVGTDNPEHFFIATQDAGLRRKFRQPNPPTLGKDEENDCKAREALLSALSDQQIMGLSDRSTAKAIWDHLETLNEGDSTVKIAKLESFQVRKLEESRRENEELEELEALFARKMPKGPVGRVIDDSDEDPKDNGWVFVAITKDQPTPTVQPIEQAMAAKIEVKDEWIIDSG
ncbi:uncharacterized protein LOC131039599 isoform X2 [Cryptomeria japonica]|uniref:uncharacterized protein LOC131039599 isoform X2 n=1 Tax=Cryptomeria japonica TaxID=3369 RepID=UPI0027DA9807|nr:uncharacterized protein LOC131039599 isoform X2 [Cryptomeria japonica]